jgi:hypothetical protein
MGHHISAVVLSGSFNEDRALSFDMKPIHISADLTLLPLDAEYTDYWAEKLRVSGFVSDCPLLNSSVIHHMVNAIADKPLFAIIETDYFGGKGSQAAAVYRGGSEIMPPESTAIAPVGASIGPINKALRLLGVTASNGRDEFETVGLDRYRDFYELFDKYHGTGGEDGPGDTE